MLAWRDCLWAGGWLFSGALAFWHILSAGSVWSGAALAAVGLAPQVWESSQRLVAGSTSDVWCDPAQPDATRR